MDGKPLALKLNATSQNANLSFPLDGAGSPKGLASQIVEVRGAGLVNGYPAKCSILPTNFAIEKRFGRAIVLINRADEMI